MAFLIDHLDAGGAERVLSELAPRLVEVGVAPRVCILDWRPDGPLAAGLRARGVPVDRRGFRRTLDPMAVLGLRRYLGRLAPDVVHTQLECANTVGLPLGRWSGAATLTTLHTVEPKALSRGGLRLRLERYAIARQADRILCVSEALREQCRMVWRLPAARLRVVHNGIDLARFETVVAPAAALRRELGLQPGALVAMTVAVLRRPKGLEFMLRALPSLVAAHPHLCYVVVGDGEDRARLERLAAALGLGGHVLFTGARPDVERVLPAADMFVLPSLTEALPTVVAEAAASGLPVVATAVGGTVEMIEDGGSGLLVPPGDFAALGRACARLLADPGLRRRMGAHGRELARARFDLGRQAQELALLYRELVASRAARCG